MNNKFIIGIVVVLVLCGIGYFAFSKNKDDVTDEPKAPVTQKKTDTKPTNYKSKNISSVYTISYIDANTKSTINEEIILYDDNTYIYYQDSNVEKGIYGKYTIKDNALTLNGIYGYEGDSCIKAISNQSDKYNVLENMITKDAYNYDKITDYSLIKGKRTMDERLSYHLSNPDICSYQVEEY